MNHRWRQWLDGIESALHERGATLARAVVLVPYAQLMPQAMRMWSGRHAQGFAPRFETTQNWMKSLGLQGLKTAQDWRFQPALDALTARALLEKSGLGEHAAIAAPLLLEAARELAPMAAAQPPGQRAAWGEQARRAALTGVDESAPALRLEAAVAQLAVVWTMNSSYDSDIFFSSQVWAETDALIVLPGFQADPLVAGLRGVWGEKMTVLQGLDAGEGLETHQGLSLHEAADASDEAEQTAACVLRHLQNRAADAEPVAVAVIDRALTRRVRAMLADHGVQMRDETGWKLSTTQAGASVMTALRASAWNAGSDAVLDWLKHGPACEAKALRELEALLRRHPQRQWKLALNVLRNRQGLEETLKTIESWRALLPGAKALTLDEWLKALKALLQASGQWQVLAQDDAGAEVLKALYLEANELPAESLWASRGMALSEFTRWADDALEAANFKPAYPLREQVVLLPLAQMLGRNFSAIVLPGCDEKNLLAAPEPQGLWTAAQRKALGLPSREQMQAAQQAAWNDALRRAQSGAPVDIFWRRSDEGGEALQPSALIQLIQAQASKDDLLVERVLNPCPVSQPAPRLDAPHKALLPQRISASAYQDLRHCPYRYYAQRLLGLSEMEEIEGELDKRDYGQWLHEVLQRFHAQDDLNAPRGRRSAALDEVAQTAAQSQGLAQEEFLPFLAAWPKARDAYLGWLEKHEAAGWRFALGEQDEKQALGELMLFGRLDRIDRAGEAVMVIDYKTESQTTTGARIKEPLEDTQLAFYAALMPDDTLRAAYVNVGESETRALEQADIVAARDALTEGLANDMARIAQGEPLKALGEGKVCETCAARGLCRKDFWNV